ncbi:type II toxin-antitoxin system RelE/ParE family toxin [Bifidobacterium sp. ESL0763]|uniref:type II toxin-antitoxin system RelE/ParE family toxin n=1 Tax=Bifidobacterium sp. ESL0763 TaxID=2983227 RepID=UPI0023F7E4F9|nr:type II toxin-antitoxin system RelE/ParE family toxin [Bifidobacterium sp. ESL0763]MDF7663476.1 type II toxin-antitoxin system RelE/ParE family toxin [Bifidobacterium sp. ESL0763]
MRQLSFNIYQSENGNCPFDDWYQTLPAKDAAKLDAIIDRIEVYGIPTSLKMQWVKRLDADIWEIRSKFSSNIQRACYFQIRNNEYLITHGFTKKTQKTPKSEIAKAHRIQDLYQNENKRKHHA